MPYATFSNSISWCLLNYSGHESPSLSGLHFSVAHSHLSLMSFNHLQTVLSGSHSFSNICKWIPPHFILPASVYLVTSLFKMTSENQCHWQPLMWYLTTLRENICCRGEWNVGINVIHCIHVMEFQKQAERKVKINSSSISNFDTVLIFYPLLLGLEILEMLFNPKSLTDLW